MARSLANGRRCRWLDRADVAYSIQQIRFKQTGGNMDSGIRTALFVLLGVVVLLFVTAVLASTEG
jgi:hypothetical protein